MRDTEEKKKAFGDVALLWVPRGRIVHFAMRPSVTFWVMAQQLCVYSVVKKFVESTEGQLPAQLPLLHMKWQAKCMQRCLLERWGIRSTVRREQLGWMHHPLFMERETGMTDRPTKQRGPSPSTFLDRLRPSHTQTLLPTQTLTSEYLIVGTVSRLTNLLEIIRCKVLFSYLKIAEILGK